MNKGFIKSFFVYGIASSLTKFIGLFLVPVYTRIFTKEEYGSLDILIALTGLFLILGMIQVESAVQRYYYELNKEKGRNVFLNTAFWLIISVSSLISISLFSFSEYLSYLIFNSLNFSKYFIVISIIIPLANGFAFFTVLFRFLKQPFRYLFMVSLQLTFTVAITIWLVVYEEIGIVGVFYGQIIGFVIPLIFCLFWFRKVIFNFPSLKPLKGILNYSLPLVPSVFLGWVNNYINRFFMITYLALSDIGIFSVSLKIAAIFSIFDVAFRMTWGPFLWEKITQDNHKLILKKIPMLLLSVLLLGVLLISVWSKEITLLVSTSDFIEASKYIGYISLSFVIIIVLQTIGLGPLIIKKTKYNSYIALLSALSNILLLYILTPMLGLLGVVLSLLITNLIRFIISYIISEKLYYIGFPIFKMLLFISLTLLFIICLRYFKISLYRNFIFTSLIMATGYIILKNKIDLIKLYKK